MHVIAFDFLCVIIVDSSEANSLIDQQSWYVCITLCYYDMQSHIYVLHLNELKVYISISAFKISLLVITTTTTATLLLCCIAAYIHTAPLYTNVDSNK